VLLAAASLAAGWATGRGNVYETLQRLRQTASHDDSVAQYAMPAPARPVEPVSALELVDTYNQQAAIPLPAPAIVPDENRHVEPLQKPPVQSRKARLAVRTPVLTAPRQARRAVYAATERQSPPIPIDTLGGRDSAAQLSGFMVSPRLDPPAPQPVPQPKQASSILEAGALIHRVDPVYPALAKDQRVQGTVKLRATIGQDGAVRSVQVVSGSALLTDAAASAVRQWRYGPTLLNGKPIGTTKDIEVQFRLQ
jgi:protein TonB